MKPLYCLIVLFSLALPSFAQEADWKAQEPPEAAAKVSKAVVKGDTAVVEDRGLIKTTKKFEKGCTLEFTWKFTKGRDEGAYQDVLSVVFRTDGKQREKHSHEIEDGLAVRFAAHAKTISVERFVRGQQSSEFITRVPATMDRGKEYKIKIHETKGFLVVHFGDSDRPVLEVKTPTPVGGHVAIYNRERGPAQQISILSGLKIK
ncbi:MAG: hypothetical protein HOO67_00640 [Candidatus Peribacteraceae bacterium]|nr:hypothetical protein [Candidatus Peribacteraceae bacterium]